jgi:RNA polymerase sigma-70 factor (ECF subfamily)
MSPEEEKVWRAIQQKDGQLFQYYYLENYRAFLLVAYKYLRDQGLALEVVNDVFVTIWEDAASINIQTSLKSYIHRAVINRSLNVVLKDKKDKQRLQDLVAAPQGVAESRELEENELKTRLYKEIELLPEQCRKVFKLSRFEGKKKQEIADELGISVKTVKNHLNRALKTLNKVLGDWKSLHLLVLIYGFTIF